MASSLHPWLDVSHAPIYQHNFPEDAPYEEVMAFIDAWEKTATARPEPYGVVVDLTHVLRAPPAVRRAFADQDKRMAEFDRKFCAASALVVPNVFARGVVTAIFWLSPPVYPYKFFATVADGQQWVKQQLAKRWEAG
jgi:hypothetical protein